MTTTRKIAKCQSIIALEGSWSVAATDWQGRVYFHRRRDLTFATAEKLMLKVREAGAIDLAHWVSRQQGNLAA